MQIGLDQHLLASKAASQMLLPPRVMHQPLLFHPPGLRTEEGAGATRGVQSISAALAGVQKWVLTQPQTAAVCCPWSSPPWAHTLPALLQTQQELHSGLTMPLPVFRGKREENSKVSWRPQKMSEHLLSRRTEAQLC